MTSRARGPLQPHDWGPAVAIAVIQLGAGRAANMHQPGLVRLDLLGYALLAVGPALLLARRYRPYPVLLGTLAATVAYVLLGYGWGPIFVSLIVAFLYAGTTRSRWHTYPLLPVGYLAMVWPVPALISRNPPNVWAATGIAAWLVVLVAITEGIRQRRAVVEARRRQAEAARHDEEAQRLRRASEERLAIARELHDVLGHSLSLINVQSSVALELFDRKPEQAATALAAIRDASRDALGEVHTLLRSIRGDNESAPTAPVPSIADLDAVVHHTRAAGVDVTTSVTGTVRRLPSVVDVAAARIVRESLTNIARHAPGARATVTITYATDSLGVRIDDDGPAVSAPTVAGGGSGIAGMVERAEALGGQLTAAPKPGGGFRVQATLPLAQHNPVTPKDECRP